MEEGHLAEEVTGHERGDVVDGLPVLSRDTDHAAGDEEEGRSRPALGDDTITGGGRAEP